MLNTSENKITCICFSIFTICIFTLYSVSLVEPPITKISEIKFERLNEKVRIFGNLTWKKEFDEFMIFRISDGTGNVTVISNNIVYFEKAEVIGIVKRYNNNIEIYAIRVKRVV